MMLPVKKNYLLLGLFIVGLSFIGSSQKSNQKSKVDAVAVIQRNVQLSDEELLSLMQNKLFVISGILHIL